MKIRTAIMAGLLLLGLAGCSSYPSWVPDWAQVGAETKS
jgi:hypothetical protein